MMLTIAVDMNIEDTNRDRYVRAVEKVATRRGLDTCVIKSKKPITLVHPSSPILYTEPYKLHRNFVGVHDEFTVDVIMTYLAETCYTNVVVMNRSQLIGKPLIQRLIDNDFTVSVVHSGTEYGYAQKLINNAEIIISATGKDLSDTYNLGTSDVQILIDVSADFTSQWGSKNINGDLIEVITDVEIGQRNVAALVEHILSK